MSDIYFDSKPKELFIITNEKSMRYAEYLSALIAMEDDITDENNNNTQVVGVKDGSIKAEIMSEKLYKDNQTRMSSSRFRVFIGDSATTKAIAAHMSFEKELEDFGIKIGTLGNNAVVFCNPKEVNRQKTYDAFFEEYQRLMENLHTAYGNVSEQKKAKNVGEKINDGVNAALEKGFTGVAKATKKIFSKDAEEQENIEVHIPKWITSTATGVATALTAWPVAVVGIAAMGISKAKSNAERAAQQMTFAVLWFYLNRLNEFMRLPENG